MNGKVSNNAELLEAIQDLTRAVLATSGQFMSKSEMIRKLYHSSMSPSRIARLLGMQSNDVTSAIARSKRSGKKVAKTLGQVAISSDLT